MALSITACMLNVYVLALLCINLHCCKAHDQGRKLVYENIVQQPCPDGAPCNGKPYGTYGIPEFWKNHPNIHWRCTRPGMLALTFDDGPSIYVTGQVLDKLKELGVKATFFINGKMINSSTGPLLTRAEKEGHVVASHTYNHKGMASKADWEIEQFLKDEIDATETKANPYLPLKGIQKFLRPPYLQMDDKMATKLADRGYSVIEISIDTNDWRSGESLGDMTGAFTNNMADSSIGVSKNSYIALQHDIQQRTVPVIEPVVLWARSKGYQLVTIDECVDMNYFPSSGPPSPTPQPTPTKQPTKYPTDSDGNDGKWDNCNGPPCETYPKCRSKYGYCGLGDKYCNIDSQWTPWDCNDTPIEQSTDAPSKHPSIISTKTPTKKPTIQPVDSGKCSGPPCKGYNVCRSKDGVCGRGSDYCNEKSQWTRSDCDTTAAPTDGSADWNNCNGPPCKGHNVCRSKDGECGRGSDYCNINSQWTPWDCGTTAAPTDGSADWNNCNGPPCRGSNACRSKDGECGTGSAYCNINSQWTPWDCSTTAPPVDGDDDGLWNNCNGPPCVGDDVCRSKDGECGTGSDYCNIDSQWTPWDCSTNAPTGSKWDICTGAPCSGYDRCRSKWGYCGSTDEYCNAESLWTPWDCNNRAVGFLTSKRVSLKNTTAASTSGANDIPPSSTVFIFSGLFCTFVFDILLHFR